MISLDTTMPGIFSHAAMSASLYRIPGRAGVVQWQNQECLPPVCVTGIREGAYKHAADLADEPLLLLGARPRPGAADGEPGGFLEIDVRQHLLFGELDGLLLVAGGEVVVALDRD